MRVCHIENLDLPETVIQIVNQSLADDSHLSWPLGRVDLQQGCFVNVEDGETRSLPDARFEAHDRYVDLQYVVSGDGESMQWCKREGLLPNEDLREASDLLFFEEPADQRHVFNFVVTPGQVIVFLPIDGHKPSLPIADKTCNRRKYVYKIPVSFFN